jgi:hypothetical protein
MTPSGVVAPVPQLDFLGVREFSLAIAKIRRRVAADIFNGSASILST